MVTLLLIIFNGFAAIAQEPQTIKPLKVGDRVPESFWGQEHTIYQNGKTITQTLAAYKGKLLILDFWATWCGSCLISLPHFNALSKTYKEKVLFLPVTYQSEGETLKYLKKNKYDHLNFIVNDQYIASIFPHQILPHYVWIDSEGTIVKFTETVGLGASDVINFIDNEQVSLANKVDVELLKYNQKKPFLIDGNGGNGNNVLYHSVLTNFSGKLIAGTSVSFDEVKGWKINAFDVPLITLFKLAYGVTRKYQNNKNIIYKVEHTDKLISKLHGMKYVAWKAAGNAYSYEIMVPPTVSGEEAFKMMQQDLSKLFKQYKISEETELAQVMALVQVDTLARFKAKGKHFEIKQNADGITISNGSFDQFIALLEKTLFANKNSTSINETNFTGNIDLQLNVDFADLNQVNKGLETYGLKFISAERPISKLIIADSSFNVKETN